MHGINTVNNFIFEILEIIEDWNFLYEKEDYWINYYNTLDRKYGYNIREASKNAPIAEETKKKMSESQKGRKHSKTTRRKISKINKGRKLTEKQREKISRNQSILTDEQALDILTRAKNKETVNSISKDYPQSIVKNIIKNKTYKHINRKWFENLKIYREKQNQKKGEKHPNAKITEEQAINYKHVEKQYNNGWYL